MESEEKKTWVINIFGGPGAGKSTAAASIFSEFKRRGESCELVDEFAKGLTWDASMSEIKDQVYCLGNQYHKIKRLAGKVEFIITDSPVLLNIVYGRRTGYNSDVFNAFVRSLDSEFMNLNVFIDRGKSFEATGRIHDEAESEAIDSEIKDVLLDIYGSQVFLKDKLWTAGKVIGTDRGDMTIRVSQTDVVDKVVSLIEPMRKNWKFIKW